MDDGFEAGERRRIAHHRLGELAAVDALLGGGTRKRRFDRGRSLAGIEPMHGGIGIEHRHAGLGEKPGGGRLAHADRAGQPQHHHRLLHEVPSPAQKGDEGEERQAENGEVIALDAGKEVNT